MLILQKIKAFIKQRTCKHEWHRVAHHGLPGEPFFMACDKCVWLKDLDVRLTDSPRGV